MTDRNTSHLVTRAHSTFLLAAAFFTWAVVTMGGIVCITGSGNACPDWPTCYGRLVPPLRADAVIEYTHRLTALMAAPFIVGSAVVGGWKARANRWVSVLPAVAVVLVIAVSIFGAFAVLTGLPPLLAAIDLASALAALALIVFAAVVGVAYRSHGAIHPRVSFRTADARIALGAAGAVLAVFVSGVLVAGAGSTVRCLVWPSMLSGRAPDGGSALRLALAAVSAVLVAALVVRSRRHSLRLARVSAGLGVVFVGQAVLGSIAAEADGPLPLLVASVATTVAFWALLVAVVALNSVHPGRSSATAA